MGSLLEDIESRAKKVGINDIRTFQRVMSLVFCGVIKKVDCEQSKRLHSSDRSFLEGHFDLIGSCIRNYKSRLKKLQ